jgi:hypothetical protein
MEKTGRQHFRIFFLSKELIQERVMRFQREKLPLLSNAIGRADTESIWYSVEFLKELLQELYRLNAAGLRIYLGAYEAESSETEGQTCLLMVPTRINEKGKIEDVIAEEEPDFVHRLEATFSPGRKLFRNGGIPCPPFVINYEMKFGGLL